MEFKIIDNFLDKNYLQELKKAVFSPDTPWFFRESITDYKKDEEKYWYNHNIYFEQEPKSGLFPHIKIVLNKLNAVAINEIRVNSMNSLKEHYECEWHVDKNFKCKTAILYLNTCNGYTLLKTNPETKINTIENRIVIFNSELKHKAVSATDTKRRILINFNYFDSPCALTT
jgi:hypothetical protein